MRGRNIVGIYRGDAPSIAKTRASVPSVSTVNIDFESPMVSDS